MLNNKVINTSNVKNKKSNNQSVKMINKTESNKVINITEIIK